MWKVNPLEHEPETVPMIDLKRQITLLIVGVFFVIVVMIGGQWLIRRWRRK
jgi:hypothetical protein